MNKFFLISIIIFSLEIFTLNIESVNCGVISNRKQDNSEDNDDDDDYKENYELVRQQLRIMQKAMNTSANPCENFSNYACGNYKKDIYGIGVYPNIASEDYIEIAFQDNSKLFDAAVKARDFYVSCKTKGSLKENYKRIFALSDDQITWPILENNHNHKTARYNLNTWIKISEHLKLLQVPTLLELNFTNDQIWEISYGRDFTSNILNQDEINEMEIIMREFGVNSDKIQIVITEINEFVRNRSLLFNSIAVQCHHCPHEESYYLRIDFRTLKEDFQNVNWDRYFEIVFQRKPADWESIHIKHYLRTVPYLEFISNTDNRILTNYVIWKLLRELKRIEYENENCAVETFNKFGSVLPALYSQVLFNDFHREQYLEILKRFKESFEQSKCRYDTINSKDLEHIFKTEIDYIRDLDIVYRPEILNNDFKFVDIYPNNYYQNLINLGNHKDCVLHEKECIKRVNLMVFIFEIASMYNKPLYYSFTDKYFSLWDTITRNAFNRGWNSIKYELAKSCAKIQSMNQNYFSLIGESDPNQSVIMTTTLKQVISDYKKWLIDNEDLERERIFNEFNVNSKKVFFINFAQAHCNQEERHRASILQSLLNLDEFSKEFKCSHNDLMNPSIKCKVW